MKTMRRLVRRVTSCATSASDEEVLRAEIDEHLAMQTAENLRAGMSPIEARQPDRLGLADTGATKIVGRFV